jgi:hypothetical protein
MNADVHLEHKSRQMPLGNPGQDERDSAMMPNGIPE